MNRAFQVWLPGVNSQLLTVRTLRIVFQTPHNDIYYKNIPEKEGVGYMYLEPIGARMSIRRTPTKTISVK